jgi:uncharacterized protein involved in type VI secretion and phage assembly
MSNGDFEVLPRGSIEELRVLREFVHKLTSLSQSHDLTPQSMLAQIEKINLWYAGHNDRYPNV